MADKPSKGGAEPDELLRSSLLAIMAKYREARSGRVFGKSHPVWSDFASAADALSGSSVAREFPNVAFKWSVGRGNWATVPWIAALDTRETKRTSEGVYVIYLFRADMSGLYLTLNQGTSWFMSRYSDSGAEELHRRALHLRARVGQLAEHSFCLDEEIDLRTNAGLAKGYQKATVAFRSYDRDTLPREEELFTDLREALGAYHRLVPSWRIFQDADY